MNDARFGKKSLPEIMERPGGHGAESRLEAVTRGHPPPTVRTLNACAIPAPNRL